MTRILWIGAGVARLEGERVTAIVPPGGVTTAALAACDELYAVPWEVPRILELAEVLHRLEPFTAIRHDADHAALAARLRPLLGGGSPESFAGELEPVPRRRLLMVLPFARLSNKARELNFYSIAMWNRDEARLASFPKVAEVSDEFYMFDVLDPVKLDRVLGLLSRRRPIDSVLLLGSEIMSGHVTAIAQRHGPVLNPLEVVQRINHKRVMREYLQERGFSTVRFRVAAQASELAAAVREFGFPAVVKPSNLSGSTGVVLVRDARELARAFELNAGYRGEFLVEEYLEGIEVSVEGLTFDGEHHILGVTDKLKTPPPVFVEVGHVFPSRLPAEVQDELARFVRAFLDLVGLRFGPSHTEVILTAAGPRIVESHARFGGDRLTTLVKLATGIRTVTAVFSYLAGRACALRPQKQEVAAIRFFELAVGRRFEVLANLDELRTVPYVRGLELYLQRGQRTPEITDSSGRHGHVIVIGRDHDEAQRNLDDILSRLQPVYLD